MKKQKKQNNKLRSKVYRASGISLIGASTLGGVGVYEFAIKPQAEVGVEIQQNIQFFLDNMFIEPETAKLNMVLAIPFLISLIVFLVITLKKNKAYFSDKMSMGLLTLILVLYLIYSLIGYMMSSLIGALAGVLIDEFIFMPLSIKAKKQAELDKDYEVEYKKEKVRLKAKRDVESGYEGVV